METRYKVNRNNLVICLLVAIMLSLFSFAQDTEESQGSVRIYFKQGSQYVDKNYMNNNKELDRLASLLETYMQENGMGGGVISVSAFASPEGSIQVNEKLANARAQAVVDLLGKRVGGDILYKIDHTGIDWHSLIAEVEANDKVPHRNEVLDILKNTPETSVVNGKTIDERNRQLQKLHGGESYRWLLKNVYPRLRYAAVRTDVLYALEFRVLTESPISIEAKGGPGEILYEKSADGKVVPKVSTDAKWIRKIKVTPSSVTFEAAVNTIAAPRTANLTLDYYGIKQEVVVCQQGAAPQISFPSGKTVSAAASGGEYAVAYGINIPNAENPAVECDVDWVRDIVVENGKISFNVDVNQRTEPREALLRVSGYDLTEYVVVRQLKATPDMVLVDAENALEKRESVMIYFRQGSSVIDKNYMDNGANLERLASLLESYIVDDAKTKGRVRINASASPEGTVRINNRLVNARAKAISDWISKKFNTNIGYEIDFKGIDWTMLLALIEQSEDMPYKDEVIDIIKNTPDQVTRNGVVINERERMIERLHKGEAYRWLLKNIYPYLRYAAVETYVMYARELTITTESPVYYPASGGEGVIEFKKNISDKIVPAARSEASWIKDIEPTTDAVAYTVVPNLIAAPRFTVISVEAYGTQHDVIIFQEAAEPALTITSELPVKVSAEGGPTEVSYVTNAPDQSVTPEVTTPAEWISNISTDEYGVIAFDVAPNPMAEPRSAVMTVNYYGKEQEFVVEQAPAEPAIYITSETPINMPAEGGTATASYEINMKDAGIATVSCPADWITSIEVTEDEITFVVRPNRHEEPRTTSLLVEYEGLSTEVVVNQESSDCKLPLYASLQSNLLYDALITPNAGAEIYLGKNFSLDGNWNYAWWRVDNRHYYWRTYGGDLALRWWFGREANLKPLTGHHVGAYGQMITYDFEFGKSGVLADRWSWSVGLEYGYSLPIAERLNLDFTIGLGYHWGKFSEYKPIDGHYVWQATKHRQYMGPTKFEVSLVWLIGCDNYNKGKEKKR